MVRQVQKMPVLRLAQRKRRLRGREADVYKRQVLLEAQLVDDTAAHGEGRDAGCADHGVELFALREEEVRQLCDCLLYTSRCV